MVEGAALIGDVSPSAAAGTHPAVVDTSRFPVTASGGRTVVRLAGEVDVFSAGALRQALDAARHRFSGDVDVHAGGVTFMDSSAVHVLVHAQRQLRGDDRRLRVVEPSDVVARLLRLSRAERLYGEVAPAP